MKALISLLVFAFPMFAQAKIDVTHSPATSAFSADQDAVELVSALKLLGVWVDATDQDSGFVNMNVSGEIVRSREVCGGTLLAFWGSLYQEREENWQDDRAHTVRNEIALGNEHAACAQTSAQVLNTILNKWDADVFANKDISTISFTIDCSYGVPVGKPAYQSCFVRTYPTM